jgi:hypothetical protein
MMQAAGLFLNVSPYLPDTLYNIPEDRHLQEPSYFKQIIR